MDENPQPTVTNPVVGASQPVQPVTPAPKKKSLLWLWITLPLGLLLVAGSVFFALFVYPGLQARAIATEYVGAVKRGDSATIKRLSDDEYSNFMRNVTVGLKDATYSMANVKSDNGAYTVNFDVKGSTMVKDISLVVKSGKVTKFNLNTKTSSTDTTKKDETTQTTAATTCLTVADLKASDITYIDTESLNAYIGTPGYLETLFFNPDSTDYTYDDGGQDFDKIAKIYKDHPTKRYTFHLVASVHESASTAAGAALANQRAEKVKNELVSRGVPAERIEVMPTETSNYTDAPEIDRNIEIKLSLPADCPKQ